MSKTPNYDAKVKAILDATQPGERTCALTGEKWMMTEEEIGWYKKFNVPPSKYAPLTRMWVMGTYASGPQFWYCTDAISGQRIISSLHPSGGVKVTADELWFEQDFSSVYREDDPSRDVLQTIRELELAIPFTAFRYGVKPINSISVLSLGDENSYFVLASRSKNTFFGINAVDVENSAEIFQGSRLTDCYNISHSERLHDCRFVMESRDCMRSAFLFDCRDCEDCFLATNKRRKKFIFKNEQLSEGEYRNRVKHADMTCRSTVSKLWDEFVRMVGVQAVWPENFNEQAADSNGEYLTRVTNCRESYFTLDGQDQFQVGFSFDHSSQNAFSIGLYGANNTCYSALTPGSSQIRYCYLSVRSQQLEYCIHCYNCEFCFGCVGLNRKKYHIFNKPYVEEDYWAKVDELKCRMLAQGTYGEFFPAAFSPMYAPLSGAAQYYSAGEKDLEKLGAQKFEPESNGAAGDEVDPSLMRHTKDVPDCLADFSAEWAGQPVFDDAMHRRFSFLKPEIDFYHRMKIAPPARHFICRIMDLAARVNSGQFISVACTKCHAPLTVARNKMFPDRTIYCRACYLEYLEKNG